MKTFTIIKKNRKYFACTFESGAKFKLVIDDNSTDLDPGVHTLDIKDQSVRTKYGTDLIFSLAGDAKEQANAGICTLDAPYNVSLVEQCKELGGTWDRDSQVWVFSGLISDQVEELEATYTDDPVPVEVTAQTDLSEWHGSVTFAGYVIATASGRDSGAQLGRDVAKVSGAINSGGSVKNWSTRVTQGSVFRLMVPRGLLESLNTDEWTYKIL